MISDHTAYVLGIREGKTMEWREAAPTVPEAELVPYMRQLAIGLSADLKVRKEDLAYWQAAEQIDDLCEALWQLLDDMGPDQFCVCPAAKEQASTALARARGEA